MVDSLTPDGMPKLGVVEVATTNFGGHSPEFWAKQLTQKIVGYSDQTDPSATVWVIRLQTMSTPNHSFFLQFPLTGKRSRFLPNNPREARSKPCLN